MHWRYYINFYIFYEAFKSFEMNFKHSSGKKKKSVETLYKKTNPRKKSSIASFISDLSLRVFWLF